MPKYTSTCMSCILLRMSEDELTIRLLSCQYDFDLDEENKLFFAKTCVNFIHKNLYFFLQMDSKLNENRKKTNIPATVL